MKRVLVLIVMALGLSACSSGSDEYEKNQKMDTKAYWTDAKGKSHYGHTARFISNVYADSTYMRVVGHRYYCLTDKESFDLPEPAYDYLYYRKDGSRVTYSR